MDRTQRRAFIRTLSPAEAAAILYDWRVWARDNQLPPPGRWSTWLILAGRGFGKTRTGAEWINDRARHGQTGRLALLGATSSDVRDTMIEGVSGVLACARPDFMPRYQPSKRRLVWPNGAVAALFSGEEPERLRGPQHEYVWVDELPAFQYPQEAWEQMRYGLRLGPSPRVVVTTTPKPIPIIVELALGNEARRIPPATACDALRNAAPDAAILHEELRVVLTTGSSYENRVNLSESWFRDTVGAVEGTRMGDQEIYARILTDVPGALWKMETIEADRLRPDPITLEHPRLPTFGRVVVAVDPAVSTANNSNETGIMVCARSESGRAGYLLADYSGRYTPDQWARKVAWAYQYHQADRIVAEKNQGGDLVRSNIHTVDEALPVKLVTATRGKTVRAEPVAALYEQHKIHHVGTFGALETQMTTWVPDSGMASPDRYDALVWGFTELMLGKQSAYFAGARTDADAEDDA